MKRCFGFPFPDDFFRFWDFLGDLKGRALSLAEDTLGIVLANVFQVFEDPSATGLETPFYRDPPEFVTLLVGDADGLHWGYYVDDPGAGPFPVANYYHNDAFQLSVDSDLPQAVAAYAGNVHDQVEELIGSDPGSAEEGRQKLQRIDAVRKTLAAYQSRGSVRRVAAAPTRDGMGIVVPAGSYAPLGKVDPFRDALYSPSAAEVERLRTAALDALRNGYPGTALKLGKDLWDYAEFFEVSCELLAAAYDALGRPLLRQRLDGVIRFRKAADQERADLRRNR